MRTWFAIGGVLAALAVIAGAFGTHTLSMRLSPERLATWETAARYHMYGALGIVLLSLAMSRWPSVLMTVAAALLLLGTIVFGGTVYALALGAPRWLGAITPIGGLGLIAGWIVAAIAAWRG